MPPLWSQLRFMRLARSSWGVVVQRSGNLPIMLRLDDMGRYLAERHVRFASSLLHRASVLHCYMDRPGNIDWNWANHLAGCTLNQLRELRLASWHTDLPSSPLWRPLNAPQLEHCELSVDLPVFAPKLRSFTLSGSILPTRPRADGGSTSLSRLLLLLNTFTHLNCLTLRRRRLLVNDVPTSPHLEMLHMHSMRTAEVSCRELAALLERLRLPATMNFHAYWKDAQTQDDCTRLAQALVPQLCTASRVVLRIFRPSSDMNEIAAQVGSAYECKRTHITSRGVVFSSGTYGHRSLLPDALLNMLQPLTSQISSQITELFVDDLFSWDQVHKDLSVPPIEYETEDLASPLLPLRRMTYLRISNRSRSFVRLLNPHLAGNVLFPVLEIIHLDLHQRPPPRLTSRLGPGAPCKHSVEVGWVGKLLVTALEARAHASSGRRLPCLVLSGPRDCGTQPVWQNEGCAFINEEELLLLQLWVIKLVDKRSLNFAGGTSPLSSRKIGKARPGALCPTNLKIVVIVVIVMAARGAGGRARRVRVLMANPILNGNFHHSRLGSSPAHTGRGEGAPLYAKRLQTGGDKLTLENCIWFGPRVRCQTGRTCPLDKTAFAASQSIPSSLPDIADYERITHLVKRNFKYVDAFSGSWKQCVFFALMRVDGNPCRSPPLWSFKRSPGYSSAHRNPVLELRPSDCKQTATLVRAEPMLTGLIFEQLCAFGILGWRDAFVGLAVIRACLALTTYFTLTLHAVHHALVQKTDTHVQTVTEILGALNTVKMFSIYRLPDHVGLMQDLRPSNHCSSMRLGTQNVALGGSVVDFVVALGTGGETCGSRCVDRELRRLRLELTGKSRFRRWVAGPMRKRCPVLSTSHTPTGTWRTVLAFMEAISAYVLVSAAQPVYSILDTTLRWVDSPHPA
ncbi:hypothetical protein PENSPDRAFT_669364 [Peniophora sp. CONT]|nr:hypothetical protein PENSPDRAFT_669364 [Peniophora sp. CONT]